MSNNSTTSSTNDNYNIVKDKLGLALNISSLIFVTIFIIIFFTLGHIKPLKWTIFGVAFILSLISVMINVRNAFNHYEETKNLIYNIIMSFVSTGYMILLVTIVLLLE